tara:strand:+ start:337 stop:513 length:177 start_codon:yes stop_codon:yes gene_type:complete
MQKPTETADQERIKEWHQKDYWNRMEFNPAWIFILPTVGIGIVLLVATAVIGTIEHLL